MGKKGEIAKMAETEQRVQLDSIEHAKAHQFPLTKFTDMNEEMLTEIQEMVLGLIEKHPVQQACKEANDKLQKKFGTGWNVVIGKANGAATTAVSGNVLQFYYQGVYAVDIWKCEN